MAEHHPRVCPGGDAWALASMLAVLAVLRALDAARLAEVKSREVV